MKSVNMDEVAKYGVREPRFARPSRSLHLPSNMSWMPTKEPAYFSGNLLAW